MSFFTIDVNYKQVLWKKKSNEHVDQRAKKVKESFFLGDHSPATLMIRASPNKTRKYGLTAAIPEQSSISRKSRCKTAVKSSGYFVVECLETIESWWCDHCHISYPFNGNECSWPAIQGRRRETTQCKGFSNLVLQVSRRQGFRITSPAICLAWLA